MENLYSQPIEKVVLNFKSFLQKKSNTVSFYFYFLPPCRDKNAFPKNVIFLFFIFLLLLVTFCHFETLRGEFQAVFPLISFATKKSINFVMTKVRHTHIELKVDYFSFT